MRVCIIGAGYVGLVTGACLAEIGHQVICVDSNDERVTLMASGKSPIQEPQLEEIMQANIAMGRLEFTTNFAKGVDRSEIIFIAIETPAFPTGEIDTNYVEKVAKSIGSYLNGEYKVIVNRSTLPIDSSDQMRKAILNGLIDRLSESLVIKEPLEEIGTIAGFDVVSNPEFLREGSAVYDTFNPDRIVLGSNSEQALAMMRELYQPIVDRQECAFSNRIYAENKFLPPVLVMATDLCSAETIKYATNVFSVLKDLG